MKDMKSNIEAALSRSVCGGWDRGFLESILEQIEKGRSLSTKQKQTLGVVLARNSVEAQSAHDSWSTLYESDYKEDARILATYHIQQPYYKPMSRDILAGRVPERRKFLRMYENKYSKKVLSQASAECKYSVGDYMVPRATLNSHKHIEFEGDMLWVKQNTVVAKFKKRGGFIIEIRDEIHSAARGAKRYKLLPVGETMPIIVEERYLKRGSRSK